MAMLTIRELDPVVHQRLREQAAAHGRSMEAEARAILAAGVTEPAPEPADFHVTARAIWAGTHLTEDEAALMTPDRSLSRPRAADFGQDP